MIASTYIGGSWGSGTQYAGACLLPGDYNTNLQNRASMGRGVYYNTTGQVVANSLDELFAGNYLAPIKSLNGTTLTGTQAVFTGANALGEASGNCNNWTQTAGNVNGTGTNWLFQRSLSCASTQRLYCVGR